MISIVVVLRNHSTQDTKKRKLRADIEAAKIVETEKFLQALRKIDSFRLDDVEKAKKSGIRSHFSSRPSIAARIENLLSAKGPDRL